jgi:hypothetical protein
LLRQVHNLTRLRRNALVTTDTELSAIASPFPSRLSSAQTLIHAVAAAGIDTVLTSFQAMATWLRNPVRLPLTGPPTWANFGGNYKFSCIKNPVRYKFYVTGCGRYARLDELWGKLRK